jgi:hypothetical protein
MPVPEPQDLDLLAASLIEEPDELVPSEEPSDAGGE